MWKELWLCWYHHAFSKYFFLFLLFVDLIHFGEPLCVGYCDRGRPTYEFSVCFTTYIGYSTLHIFGARMAGGSWMTVLAVHVVLCVFAVCVCVCAFAFTSVWKCFFSSYFFFFLWFSIAKRARHRESDTNGRVSYKIHTRYVFSMRCQINTTLGEESKCQMPD